MKIRTSLSRTARPLIPSFVVETESAEDAALMSIFLAHHETDYDGLTLAVFGFGGPCDYPDRRNFNFGWTKNFGATRARAAQADAESLLALALSAGLAECERLRGGYAFEYARGCRAGAAAVATPASAPPVVEVPEVDVKNDRGVYVTCIGDHGVFWSIHREKCDDVATKLREAAVALWPPQVAAGGSWEGAIAWLETTRDETQESRKQSAMQGVYHQRFYDGFVYATNSAIIHLRTLSAPGAGGVKEPKYSAWELETRDAEIGRLRGEVEEARLFRHMVLENVVAAERESCADIVSKCRERVKAGSVLIEVLEEIEDAIVSRSAGAAITDEAKALAATALERFEAKDQARTAGGGGGPTAPMTNLASGFTEFVESQAPTETGAGERVKSIDLGTDHRGRRVVVVPLATPANSKDAFVAQGRRAGLLEAAGECRKVAQRVTVDTRYEDGQRDAALHCADRIDAIEALASRVAT